MKIIYLALVELDIYGAPRTHTIEVCNNLTKLGHTILLLCPRPYKERAKFNFNVVYLPFFGFGFIRELIYHLIEAFYLIYFIIKFKPDIVYERESMNLFPAIICKILRKKHFIEVNGWLLGETKASKRPQIYIIYIRLLEQFYYRLATGIIVVSDALKDKIVKEYKISPSKICVIYNGVDVEKFYPMDINKAKERINFSNDYKYIGYVGGFFLWYDLETVIYSIKDVIKKFPEVRLVLIGGTEGVKKYKELVNKLNITKNVIFGGNVPYEEIPFYINSFNICIIPLISDYSVIGGATLKLLEYLACGKITILNRIPSFKQFFDVTVLVKEKDKDALTNCILNILENFNNYEGIGKRARKLIEEKFTWQKTARNIIKFVERM